MNKNTRRLVWMGIALAINSFLAITAVAQPSASPVPSTFHRPLPGPQGHPPFGPGGEHFPGYVMREEFDTSETLAGFPRFEVPEIVRFTAQEFPDLHARIQMLGDTPPPDRFEMFSFLQQMMELQKTNPEMFKLEKTIYQMESETEALGETIRNNADKADDKALESLKTKLGKLFDLREQRREMEAQQIEADLKHVRTLLKQRRENRDAIIDKRLKELTGANDATEW